MTIASRAEEGRNTDFLIGNAVLIASFLGASLLVFFGIATKQISQFIYFTIDLPAFCAVGLIAALSTAFYYTNPRWPAWANRRHLLQIKPWHLALVTLIAIAAAIGPVYHGFALSMDEHMTRFQAAIFSAGHLTGEVPPDWRFVGRALFNSYAILDGRSAHVYSFWRPGMAALYALFDLVGLGRYTSAVMSAGSVILVASVARLLWPRSDSAPIVAALLLATSQQVLFTGLTAYAMPAELFFNLLWLRLFLADRPWAHVLAALVGVATAALHHVHTHLFFAAPFLLTLFRPFRPWLIAWYGTTYLLGHASIIGWDQIALGAAAGEHRFAARVASYFEPPGLFQFSTLFALLVRWIAWQNLAVVPLVAIAIRRAQWSTPLRLMGVSIALSVVPSLFFMPDQGYGWGYRYLHGLIGNLSLIASAGWLAVEKMGADDKRRICASLAAAGILSISLMLPLRAVQVEALVAPHARAEQYIRSMPDDVVVIDAPAIYYGHDLVRNDAFVRNRPVILNMYHLNMAQIQRLCAAHPHSVRLVGAGDLTRFGLLKRDHPRFPPPDWQAMRAQLKAPPCAGR